MGSFREIPKARQREGQENTKSSCCRHCFGVDSSFSWAIDCTNFKGYQFNDGRQYQRYDHRDEKTYNKFKCKFHRSFSLSFISPYWKMYLQVLMRYVPRDLFVLLISCPDKYSSTTALMMPPKIMIVAARFSQIINTMKLPMI